MTHNKYFDDIRYQSLSASTYENDKGKSFKPYFENLDTAFGDKTVRNIAIFGKFGAGKSTVINSYLQYRSESIKDDRRKSNRFQRTKEYILGNFKRVDPSIIRPLKLSTATFTRTSNSNQIAEKLNGWIDIEQNLVQQMLYGPKNRVLPDSKFRKIEPPSKLKWLFIAFLLVVAFVSISAFINLGGILNFFFQRNIIRLIKVCSIISLLILFGILSLIVACNLPRYLNSAKLAIGKSELSISDKRSAFNEYLDEIIYYFSRTKYNLVILEDIDRADNLNIFEHLRELNQILNSNQVIQETYKVKPGVPAIRFLYAVKEDLFNNQMLVQHDISVKVGNKHSTENSDESSEKNNVDVTDAETEIAEATTKFFDWTLTILPRVSSVNAADFLMQSFDNPTSDFKKFLRTIGSYFEDVRVLENAVNDLKLYLTLQQGDEVDTEKLFTALLFKNGYPTEYQRFLRNSGNLSKLLRNRLLAEQHLKKLKEQLKSLQTNREKVINNSERQVINRYLVLFLKLNIQTSLRLLSEDRNVKIEKPIDMTFSQLANFYRYVVSNGLRFYDEGHGQYVSSEVLEISDEFFDSKQIFAYDDLSRNALVCNNRVQETQNQIDSIERLSVTEIAQNNPGEVSDILIDAGNARGFLTFAVVNGYIDETTEDYFTLFPGERISRKDRSIVLRIRSGEKVSFDEHIDNIQNFVAELETTDYPMPGMALKEIILYGLNQQDALLNRDLRLAFDASVKQLSATEPSIFSYRVDETLDKIDEPSGVVRLITDISENLKYDWGKYQGQLMETIAPIMLENTKVAHLDQMVSSSPLLTDYLNKNNWKDALDVSSDEPEKAQQIFGNPNVIISKLNQRTQASRDFIGFLINQDALACTIETVPTILNAYQDDSNQPISSVPVFEDGNEILTDYIKKNSEQFLTAEINLNLISNETNESMAQLVKLPSLTDNTTKMAFEKYPRNDLILSNYELENGPQGENMVELIVGLGKEKYDWGNLIFLDSLPNSDKKDLSIQKFIQDSNNLSMLTAELDSNMEEVLRRTVGSHAVEVTSSNEKILKKVENYQVSKQSPDSRSKLIKWNLVELNDELLELNLTESELIDLGVRYLLEEPGSWNEQQNQLFQKLQVQTLVKLIINKNHRLHNLDEIALNTLSTSKIDDNQFTNNQKIDITKYLMKNLLNTKNWKVLLIIYNSIDENDNKIDLLTFFAGQSNPVWKDELVIKLIAITEFGNLSQLTNSQHQTVKITNDSHIEKLVIQLKKRKLVGKTEYKNNRDIISVYRTAKLRKFND